MLVFGHRGARGEAPENTLEGFAYAVAHGTLALELDVRLTADRRLAVIHDATVDRTTNATGPVASFTAAELAKLDARAGVAWPQPVRVPLLEDVLQAHGARLRLAIELKTDTPERLEQVCAALVSHLEAHRPRAVTATSFDPAALEIMRRRAPHVPRAFIGAYDSSAFLETALRLECRQADVQLSRGSAAAVTQAQAAGLRVVGWPGNTAEHVHALLEWGVDGITSDYPGRTIALLRERGVANEDDWS
ncbi:MAG TPA: glycerophosphodiester phosphodiesterase family protein [Chloroflexota bacterium]|nr:glycerophosphodiester phosphodiesterase family protein [Chloroflexota bacterium]